MHLLTWLGCLMSNSSLFGTSSCLLLFYSRRLSIKLFSFCIWIQAMLTGRFLLRFLVGGDGTSYDGTDSADSQTAFDNLFLGDTFLLFMVASGLWGINLGGLLAFGLGNCLLGGLWDLMILLVFGQKKGWLARTFWASVAALWSFFSTSTFFASSLVTLIDCSSTYCFRIVTSFQSLYAFLPLSPMDVWVLECSSVFLDSSTLVCFSTSALAASSLATWVDVSGIADLVTRPWGEQFPNGLPFSATEVWDFSTFWVSLLAPTVMASPITTELDDHMSEFLS